MSQGLPSPGIGFAAPNDPRLQPRNSIAQPKQQSQKPQPKQPEQTSHQPLMPPTTTEQACANNHRFSNGGGNNINFESNSLDGIDYVGTRDGLILLAHPPRVPSSDTQVSSTINSAKTRLAYNSPFSTPKTSSASTTSHSPFGSSAARSVSFSSPIFTTSTSATLTTTAATTPSKTPTTPVVSAADQYKIRKIDPKPTIVRSDGEDDNDVQIIAHLSSPSRDRNLSASQPILAIKPSPVPHKRGPQIKTKIRPKKNQPFSGQQQQQSASQPRQSEESSESSGLFWRSVEKHSAKTLVNDPAPQPQFPNKINGEKKLASDQPQQTTPATGETKPTVLLPELPAPPNSQTLKPEINESPKPKKQPESPKLHALPEIALPTKLPDSTQILELNKPVREEKVLEAIKLSNPTKLQEKSKLAESSTKLPEPTKLPKSTKQTEQTEPIKLPDQQTKIPKPTKVPDQSKKMSLPLKVPELPKMPETRTSVAVKATENSQKLATDRLDSSLPTLFSWAIYFSLMGSEPEVAPKDAFRQSKVVLDNKFKIGMKLVARDPRNTDNSCLASVVSCEGPRIKLRFDGGDSMNDFWELIDSENIKPYQMSEQLLPPMAFKGNLSSYPKFVDKILFKSDAVLAPTDYFLSPPPVPRRNLFKQGMKLEAIDKKNPYLICPATVGEIKGDSIKVLFDGWKGSFNYECKYYSRDIFPVNWCRDNCHYIAAPNNWESWIKRGSCESPPKSEGRSMNRTKSPVVGSPRLLTKESHLAKVQLAPKTPTAGAAKSPDSPNLRNSPAPSGIRASARKSELSKSNEASASPKPSYTPEFTFNQRTPKKSETKRKRSESPEPSPRASAKKQAQQQLQSKQISDIKQPHSRAQEPQSQQSGANPKQPRTYTRQRQHQSTAHLTERTNLSDHEDGDNDDGDISSNLLNGTTNGVEFQCQRAIPYDEWLKTKNGTNTNITQQSLPTEPVDKANPIQEEKPTNGKPIVGSDVIQQQPVSVDKVGIIQSTYKQQPAETNRETSSQGYLQSTTESDNLNQDQDISDTTASSPMTNTETQYSPEIHSRKRRGRPRKRPRLDEGPSNFPKKSYDQWAVSDILDLIKSDETISKYSNIFENHEIDGKAFILLTPPLMVNHMGLKMGPALKVSTLVEQVKLYRKPLASARG